MAKIQYKLRNARHRFFLTIYSTFSYNSPILRIIMITVVGILGEYVSASLFACKKHVRKCRCTGLFIYLHP